MVSEDSSEALYQELESLRGQRYAWLDSVTKYARDLRVEVELVEFGKEKTQSQVEAGLNRIADLAPEDAESRRKRGLIIAAQHESNFDVLEHFDDPHAAGLFWMRRPSAFPTSAV